MFSRGPYYNYPSSYYTPQDDFLYGYQNPYAHAQAQAQAEQQRRAQLLALERQRELERQRAAAAEAARRQRASQYLSDAGMMYPGQNRLYVPERASQYLPDEFDNYGSGVDNDDDAYDYGFARVGPHWNGWPIGQSSRPRGTQTSNPSVSRIEAQPPQVAQKRNHSRSRSRSRARSGSAASSSHSQNHSQIPIHESQHSESPHLPTQLQSPPTSTKLEFTSTPEMLEAASKIQTAYRIHRSLKSIDSLAKKFHDLKSNFTLPPSLDFQILMPEQHVTIPLENLDKSSALGSLKSAGLNMPIVERISTAKLAYTHSNAPIHGYVESLNRLLVSLDGVESFGEKKVRERRKEVVRAVESEAARIENMWKELWNRWVIFLNQEEEVQQPTVDGRTELDAGTRGNVTPEVANHDGSEIKDGHETDEGFEIVSASEALNLARLCQDSNEASQNFTTVTS